MGEVEIDGIPKEHLRRLPPYQRAMLGLPPEPPGLFTEYLSNTFLGRQHLFRKLFGLDQKIVIDPTYDLGQQAGPNNYSWYASQFATENDRRSIYRVVEEMDTYDVCSAALSLYAEEATQPDLKTERTVWIESENTKVKDALEEMLETIQIEDVIFSIARGTAKYGDDFRQVFLAKDKGVVGIDYVYPGKLSRIQDRYGRLRGFAGGIFSDQELNDPQFIGKLNISKPQEFVNFTVKSSRGEHKHGESLLADARSSWRQLKITEDNVILYRLNRAPDRIVYNIDVTGLSPDQQYRVVNKWRQQLRRKFMFDAAVGKYRQEYNPWSTIDDIFFPKTKDGVSNVDRLAGSANTDDMNDVDHFRRKTFGSLRIPGAFMGYEGDIDGKTGLVAQDIRFARSIKRLRRALIRGVHQLCKIHLTGLGIDTDKRENAFTVRMSFINTLEELQKSEITSLKFEQVDKLLTLIQTLSLQGRDKVAWATYVLVNYLDLTHEEVSDFLSLQISGEQQGDGSDGGGGGGPLSSDSGLPDLGPSAGEGGEGGDGDLKDLGPDSDFSGLKEVPVGSRKNPEQLASQRLPRNGHRGRTPAILAEDAPHVSSRYLRGEVEAAPPPEVEGVTPPEPVDFDLDTELGKLRKLANERVLREKTCPNRGCGAPIQRVTVTEGESKRDVLLCSKCGFAAEVEGRILGP